MNWKGKVVSVYDEDDAGRIKVRILNVDGHTDKLDYAFPLLPKMINIKPKVGEMVMIFCDNDSPNQQRYYIGPIISQPQHMYKDLYEYGASKMIGGKGNPDTAVSNITKTHGAFASDEDIAIYGRKNSDVILGDSDIRIRCGVKLTDNNDTTDIAFNRTNPSFIKLKYHEYPLEVEKKIWNNNNGTFDKTKKSKTQSSISIVGQEINLISTDSANPYTNVSNTNLTSSGSKNNGDESLSDEDLKKFIKEAHPLPYGDVLIQFLHLFIKAFKNHTHRYHQMTPVKDETYKVLEAFDINKLLSDNIRIN